GIARTRVGAVVDAVVVGVVTARATADDTRTRRARWGRWWPGTAGLVGRTRLARAAVEAVVDTVAIGVLATCGAGRGAGARGTRRRRRAVALREPCLEVGDAHREGLEPHLDGVAAGGQVREVALDEVEAGAEARMSAAAGGDAHREERCGCQEDDRRPRGLRARRHARLPREPPERSPRAGTPSTR